MLNPAWIDATAEAFWAAVGDPPPYPRDAEEAILLTQPLAIVSLPVLRPATIDAWLVRNGAAPRFAADTGRLRACLVAGQGRGIIFLAGGDPPDQRRFSLAHELAHFLIDYARPRTLAIDALGPSIAEVLDGQRPAERDERVHAALGGVPLGVHLHLLAYDDPAIAAQERATDRLAVELLAPATRALALARPMAGVHHEDRRETATTALVTEFGLPTTIAAGYADRLLRHLGAETSFTEWLGLSNLRRRGGIDR